MAHGFHIGILVPFLVQILLQKMKFAIATRMPLGVGVAVRQEREAEASIRP
jgi:hypothetical protein